MATAAHSHERRVSERRRFAYPAFLARDGMKVSWGGVFGGVLVAIGLLILLTALGVAVGITAADPGQTEAGTLGTATGLWAGVSLLVALFIGGLVSTRTGAITDRATGFFEGALVWVVSILLMMYLATTGASMIMGGATSLLGGAAQAVSGTMQMQSMDFSGSVDQIVQRLKDPKTAQQIAQTTGMEQAQVQQTLSQTAERVEANRDDPTQAAAAAKQGMGELMQNAKSSGALEQKAEELKPAASRGAWIAFGGLLLSLAAAVIGAMVGRRKESARA
jgi:hypothetical protein